MFNTKVRSYKKMPHGILSFNVMHSYTHYECILCWCWVTMLTRFCWCNFWSNNYAFRKTTVTGFFYSISFINKLRGNVPVPLLTQKKTVKKKKRYATVGSYFAVWSFAVLQSFFFFIIYLLPRVLCLFTCGTPQSFS